jgi:HAD superfamily hydrolase (TIGR01509 family)
VTPEAVVFDLDLTLLDHGQSIEEVLDAAFEAVGRDPAFGPATLQAAMGRVDGDFADEIAYLECVFAAAADEAGVEFDAGTLARAYDNAMDYGDVSLRPGAREAVDAVGDRPVALVTNGSERTHRAKLAAAGLSGDFDAVVFGSDVTRVKPDPEPFEYALAELGVDPGDCLAVGDDLRKDVRAGNAVGLRTVWVPHEEYSDPTSRPGDPTPDHRIDSLREFPALLSA